MGTCYLKKHDWKISSAARADKKKMATESHVTGCQMLFTTTRTPSVLHPLPPSLPPSLSLFFHPAWLTVSIVKVNYR